jgi:peptide/nickel transport system substrate-binding protein
LSPNVTGPKYDLAQARQLVQQAKANGWDGKIRVSGANVPDQATWAQTVGTLLQAAGMDVTVQTDRDQASQIASVVVQRDYDIATWSPGIDDNPDRMYEAFFLQLTTATYRFGYASPDMDAAVDALRTAKGDTDSRAAIQKIAEVWVRDVPFATIAHYNLTFVASAKLHGIARGSNWIMRFDKAWLE